MRRAGLLRLDDDPKVEAVWRRLALSAGLTVATGPLQGWLDTAEAGLVRGWARDAANSDMPVPVEVFVDGVVLGSTLANPLPRRSRNRRLWPRPARLRIPVSRATRLLPAANARCPARNRSRLAHRRAATVAERRSPSPRCSLRPAHRARRNDGYRASGRVLAAEAERPLCVQKADLCRNVRQRGRCAESGQSCLSSPTHVIRRWADLRARSLSVLSKSNRILEGF